MEVRIVLCSLFFFSVCFQEAVYGNPEHRPQSSRQAHGRMSSLLRLRVLLSLRRGTVSAWLTPTDWLCAAPGVRRRKCGAAACGIRVLRHRKLRCRGKQRLHPRQSISLSGDAMASPLDGAVVIQRCLARALSTSRTTTTVHSQFCSVEW
ncbi:hypothetical protein C8R45DRAFT_1032783 [Mycena sanguinolenta]|nr:hypothetical protein C8R45DRAFT_1032783 [Mycena sanguinolenta]